MQEGRELVKDSGLWKGLLAKMVLMAKALGKPLGRQKTFRRSIDGSSKPLSERKTRNRKRKSARGYFLFFSAFQVSDITFRVLDNVIFKLTIVN